MLHGDEFQFCESCRKEYDNTKRNKDNTKKDKKDVLEDALNPYGSHYYRDYGDIF